MSMILVFLFMSLIILSLAVWRFLDHRADRKAMHELMASQPVKPLRFSKHMVSHLPEPVQRYFLYTIEQGTALYAAARISMIGRFGMGNRDKPDYLDFSAIQVLAMPTGFVWKMRAQRGLMRLSGSDSQNWTRFWMIGLLPVARTGGNPDHTRSAFGRYVAESVFWTPAALLPGPGITWESKATDHARITIDYKGLSQSVDLKVAANGQPTEVRFERWSNANPEKRYRLQTFGGYLSDFRSFGGFRLPSHVEAGNHFDTD